jgi:hypothetical protein
MAKKTFADELDADSLREANALRAARAHDRTVAELKSKLAQEVQKRKQAEADLEHAEGRVDFLRSLGEPNAVPYSFKPHKPSGQATAVIVLSDWHVEETVDPSTINGLNEFNLEIAEQRIKKVFENAVMLIEGARHTSCIKDLVVAVLGDMITGYIHEELQETNSLSPTEASLFVQDHLVGGLEFLKKHSGCRSITVPAVSGNHGRTTKKNRSGSTEYRNSYEWLLYKQMERFYRSDPKIKWKVENGKHNWLDIQGHDVRFSHGHAFQYNGGVGGAFVPIRRKIGKWNETRKADWDAFGHLHTHIKDESWCMNNCLIGYGAYALDIGAKCTRPSQTLIVFDQKSEPPVLVQEIFCN